LLKARKAAKRNGKPKIKTPWAPDPKDVKTLGGLTVKQSQEQAWSDARQLVTHYVAIGYSQELIAKLLLPPISVDTLAKHFRRELDIGSELQNARVAGVAYRMAMSGNDPGMTRFWLRSRAKWRDFDGTGGTTAIPVRSIPGDESI